MFRIARFYAYTAPYYWALFLFLWGPALSAQVHHTEKDFVSLFGLPEYQSHPGSLARSGQSLIPEYRFYLAQRKKKGIQPDGYWAVVRELDSLFCIVSPGPPEIFQKRAEEHFALIIPANDQWKLAPGWEQRAARQQREPVQVFVQTNNPEALKADLERANLTKTIIAEYPEFQAMLFRISDREMKRFLLPSPWVSFIDTRPAAPTTELAVPNFDLSVNQVNLVHHQFPSFTGQGLTVSLKEYRPDSTDIDFGDRYFPSGISTAATATHATTMATIIAGAGNSFYTGKGAAPGARISSASFFNLMPEPDAYYKQAGIAVQNHSYGLGIENYYGAEARAYDELARRYPTLLHVFSSGNIGASASPSGPYAGVPGFANLTGTFKMAKNLLTVGAIDSFYRVETLSSRGPAFDGRVKPELVAFGQDGSSGAAALVSGIALLVQQAYQELHNDSLPPAALIRAVFLNSARDLGPEGPDYTSGYGSIQAAKGVELIGKQQTFHGSLEPGGKAEFQIRIPPGAAHFRATLAWADPPALVNSPKALVNDLDVSLLQGDSVWLPWVLRAFPHPDSLAAPAARGIDNRNNQEQISLNHPAPAIYTLRVAASNLPGGAQDFYVVYDWDTLDAFRWTYPTASDHAEAGKLVPVRWESTMYGQTGGLEYTFAGSSDWIPVPGEADLAAGYFRWQVPDTTALAQLRMQTPAGTVLSDTFVISKPLRPVLALDCPDSLLWYWEKAGGISQYQLYSYGSGAMRPIRQTADTAAFLTKSLFPSPYFAVAPLLAGGKTGVRSPTRRADFQNAGCYIRNFLATLRGDKAELKLELGAPFLVREVAFEKRVNGQYAPLAVLNPFGETVLGEDLSLQDGYNFYRARIALKDGRTLYTDENLLVYIGGDRFLLFPNPIRQDEELLVLSKIPKDARFRLYDSLGRTVAEEDLIAELQGIPLTNLAAGIYFYEIQRNGERKQTGRVAVH